MVTSQEASSLCALMILQVKKDGSNEEIGILNALNSVVATKLTNSVVHDCIDTYLRMLNDEKRMVENTINRASAEKIKEEIAILTKIKERLPLPPKS